MFDPVKLDGLTVRNQIVLSPFQEELADRDGQVTQLLVEHYVNFAREGAGLVIVESAFVAKQGRAHPNQLGVSDERQAKGLAQLAGAIKAEGAAVGLRLMHAGARTSEWICEEQPVGPSPINFGKDFDTCREFDDGDVEEIILYFVHAAERAEEAGFDFIEINGGSQYLLDQCLSSRHNSRYDKYGGSTGERMRLSMEIVQAIKHRISPGIPVSYLFSIHDKLEDGFGETDLKEMIKALNQAQVDIFHPVSIHVMNKFFDTEETLIEWVGRFTRKPIIADGNIKSPQIIKEVMSLKKANLLALDKVLFSRPNWYAFLQKKITPP